MLDLRTIKDIRMAIRDGNREKLKTLIDADRKRLELVTPFGTLLHEAASSGKLDVVRYLVEMGLDVNELGGIEGGGPLHLAASSGHLDIVKYLLGQGAILDVSKPERNPLFGAIYGGHIDIVRTLIDAGIDTKVRYTGKSMKNMDAKAFANERGQSEIEQILSAE